jgi:hypothetical protein
VSSRNVRIVCPRLKCDGKQKKTQELMSTLITRMPLILAMIYCKFRVIYLHNYDTIEAVLWLRFLDAGFSPRFLAFNSGQLHIKILLDKVLSQSLFRFFPSHHHSAILLPHTRVPPPSDACGNPDQAEHILFSIFKLETLFLITD